MGHDHQQSSSSGAVVAIVVAVLLVAILGILVVVGAGLFFVGTTSRLESQPATSEFQWTDQGQATTQLQHFSDLGTERLNFEVTLDREGNTSVAGEGIDRDELRARLAKFKYETGNSFYVLINTDSECPVKHVVPILDVCKELGDIDFSIEVAAVGWANDAERP